MRTAVAQGGQLIVRRGLTACRIVDEEGQKLDAEAILDLARNGTKGAGIDDTPVQLPASDDAPALPMRLIIEKKPEEYAERSRRRATKTAQRGHCTAKSKQLDAAQYLMLMTPLDAETTPATQVLAVRRCRRQIEIAFKWLKSLGDVDKL